MNEINFKKGAILLGENNHPQKGNHYIIYFEELDGYDFIGGMISTKRYRGKNILMKTDHFEIEDKGGSNWEITFNNSHIVPAKLRKFNTMGDFKQVGQLTDEGVAFIEAILNDKPLLTWDEYLSSKS